MRSSLARTPSAFTPEQQASRQEAYERELWLAHGAVILRPERIANDWLKRAVVTEAEKMHGKRAR